ncbi:toxin-antitoxin system YwqK family antitoxin [Aurantibacillus circumpalustris]|uniref:toxin-antitoxin system YwqK family antitoxin n=1 Tax=Aurantibacillus circumpalustris TaxID=3036359 RepID=UPI00295A9AF9|nr:hypothetical protein [Aurantibacillus circumpalustris]
MLKYIVIFSFFLTACREQKKVTSYYDNSKVIFSKGKKENGKMTGEWKFFYRSGKLESIEHYVDDRPVGDYTKYYENGQIKVKGAYSQDKFTEEIVKDTLENNEVVKTTIKLACRVGTWEFYDQQGNLTKKTYKNCKEDLQK